MRKGDVKLSLLRWMLITLLITNRLSTSGSIFCVNSTKAIFLKEEEEEGILSRLTKTIAYCGFKPSSFADQDNPPPIATGYSENSNAVLNLLI